MVVTYDYGTPHFQELEGAALRVLTGFEGGPRGPGYRGGSAFVYADEVIEESWGEAGTIFSKKTRYAYGGDVPCTENDCSGPPRQYGNLTLIEEDERASPPTPRPT